MTADIESQTIGEQVKTARIFARRISRKRDIRPLDVDDLMQEGLIGFLRAMRSYQPGAAKMETYAQQRMVGAMFDALDRERCGMRVPSGGFVDIDAAAHVAGDDGRRFIDRIYLQQMTDRLERAEQALPDVQREIIRLIYVNGVSQADVARQMGKSEAWVLKWRKRALNKLRILIN